MILKSKVKALLFFVPKYLHLPYFVKNKLAMQRVKTIFENPIYSTTLPIRITDLNYGNHVGNHQVVGLLHEARVQFLQSHHYSELNTEGFGLIMADLQVAYKQQLFYNDILTINISLQVSSATAFTLAYQAFNQHGQLCTLAQTNMVFYDYTLQRVEKIPKIFLIKFGLI